MTIRLGARDLRIVSPITKVEPQADGSLLVEGIATSEAVDLMGEVVDFGTSKEAFAAWRGNIREQHDPTKAVGHAIEVIPDAQAKNITVRAFVSAGAPDTQKKVIDGTLGFYSIGGRTKAVELDKTLKASDGKPARRLFMERISEVSLVDSGCNPESAVSVLKATGIEEVEKINAPKIEKKDGKYLIVDSDGKVYGTHDTKDEAKAQLAALYANKGDVMPQPIVKYDGFEISDAQSALQALDIAMSLLAWEGMEGHDEPPEQIVQLRAVVANLKAYIASEIQETETEAAAKTVDPGATPAPEGAIKSEDITPPVTTEPPPAVKQEDTPPEDPEEKPEELPQEPAGEPPAPPAAEEKVATEPASDGGLAVSGLVEKVEVMTGELATLKADLVTKGEENATLRKQVSDLQATVEKFGKRVVEPGTPVFKGPDGKPTTQPQGTAVDGAISVERITELVKAANGDPALLQRSLGMELAQTMVRKAITGK